MRRKLNLPAPTALEATLLVLCAATLSIQLLIPPYIGLANNGDFGKVCSRFSLAPQGGWGDNFIYFAPDYQFASKDYWKSDILSAEIALAAVPILAAQAAGSERFDIRWLGLLHCLLFLAAFFALLLYLRRCRPLIQFVLGLAVLWILGDVAYTAYFNSFFSDTAAILGLVLAVPFALQLAAQDRPRLATLALFSLSALLLVSSKTQHGILAFLPALFAAVTGWRSPRTRIAGVLAATLILLALALEIIYTPPLYSSSPLFDVIFFKLTPESPAPLQDLRQLGLPDSDLQYAGTHAYMPDAPVKDPLWAAAFIRASGTRALLGFYLRHPARALKFLWDDLHREAFQMRCANLSNFPRQASHPPGALTRRFASWSDLRSRLFVLWPSHIIVWYGLVIGVAALIARSTRGPARRTAALCLGIAILGILEFCLASLTDACETYRHLLLFHLTTDITICFGIAWALGRVQAKIAPNPPDS
jgi:hypothetical protein